MEEGNEKHSNIKADGFQYHSNNAVLDNDLKDTFVVFKGIGQTFAKDNVLAFSVLTAPLTSYSAPPKSKPLSSQPESIGNQLSLVTAVQGRNNARLLFCGSLELFSNKNMRNKKQSNMAFVQDISMWTFGERGVIASSNIHHQRHDGRKPDKMLKNIERPDQPISLYPDAEIGMSFNIYVYI